jgi:hypothetical protein
LAILGKGNQSRENGPIPEWRTFDLFLSYQDTWGTLTGQCVTGEGNQKGTWTLPSDPAEASDHSGCSLFGEVRSAGSWMIIGGFDSMKRTADDTNLGFRRFHAGVGYDLGSQNILLLDLDHLDWKDSTRSNEWRTRLVFQLKF